MRNKLFAVIAALVLMFGLFAAIPANGAVVPEKKACVSKWFEVGKTFSFDSSYGQPRHGQKGAIKQVRLYAKGYYDACGTYSRVTQVVYYADPLDFTGCLSGRVQNFKFNGNVVGSWNVPAQTIQCTSGTDFYGYSMTNPYHPQNIQSSAPANERCFAVDVTLSLDNSLDKSGTSPSFCVV